MIPAFRKIRSSILDIQRVQDALVIVLDSIRGKQIIDGGLINGVFLSSSSATNVDHGLGKEPRGWVIVKKDANADVYQSTSTTPNKTLLLNATADVTVSLWVF